MLIFKYRGVLSGSNLVVGPESIPLKRKTKNKNPKSRSNSVTTHQKEDKGATMLASNDKNLDITTSLGFQEANTQKSPTFFFCFDNHECPSYLTPTSTYPIKS